MTSYLVDAVLLVALLVTGWRVGRVSRDIRRLRALQPQYQDALDASVRALDSVRSAIEALRAEAEPRSTMAPAVADREPAPRLALARAEPSAHSVFVPFGAAETLRSVNTVASR